VVAFISTTASAPMMDGEEFILVALSVEQSISGMKTDFSMVFPQKRGFL
jgi:hypothetical protein